MKDSIDNFSNQAGDYKKFRPTYPRELYDFVLHHTAGREQCWDAGTGNGQVATVLSGHFGQVLATDISSRQMDQAEKRANISYQLYRAEKTPFADQQFDLITVAQAIHWFDFAAFNQEAKRVLKKNGTVAVWGYGLIQIDEEVDRVLHHFYTHTIGPYWDPERKHIDTSYQTIPFPFAEIPVGETFSIKDSWSLVQLEGYLNTWSSVQKFIKLNDRNPVEEVIDALRPIWEKGQEREVRFLVFLKIGNKA